MLTTDSSTRQKVALITGINGQDGSYLAEFLLQKSYKVHGTMRYASDSIEQNRHICNIDITLHYVDLQDFSSLLRIISQVRPDEIYNLAAQSAPNISAAIPHYTADVTAVGCLRVLEAVQMAGLTETCRIFQPSTATFFDDIAANNQPMDEKTPHNPRTHYAISKHVAYNYCRVYREGYGMFIANAIFFNHESPRRQENFVTRKVSIAVAKIKLELEDSFEVINFSSVIDWGYAKDYAEAAWRILNHDKPDDFVISTGEANSIRDLCNAAFLSVDKPLQWRGDGPTEAGFEEKTNEVRVRRSSNLAPVANSVRISIGDSSKAHLDLGWKPSVTFSEIIADMVQSDLKLIQRQQDRMQPDLH